SAPPGIYGMFASGMSPPDSGSSLRIFPNPGSLSHGTEIRFRAPDISEIRIYAATGGLVLAGSVRSGIFQCDGRDYLWRLENGSGRKVAPGTYMALVTRKEKHSGQTTSTLNKILVVP
ncbi:MAG: hypothetical protein JXA71_06590, partial [Chitinispirillaceae bacterium]|nr:hypothetical protein [Chitinispirillaceae bacterium]